MTVLELIYQGLNLMLLGMGGVFVFLSVLILSINTIASLLSWLDLAEETTQENASSFSPQQGTQLNSSELIAVISAAVGRYRSNVALDRCK